MLAFNDTTKELHTSADSSDPRFASGWLLASRVVNPAALADMLALRDANVPPRYWKRNGARVEEMSAPEKAAADAARDAANADKAAKAAARQAAIDAAEPIFAAIIAKAPGDRTAVERALLGLLVLHGRNASS